MMKMMTSREDRATITAMIGMSPASSSLLAVDVVVVVGVVAVSGDVAEVSSSPSDMLGVSGGLMLGGA